MVVHWNKLPRVTTRSQLVSLKCLEHTLRYVVQLLGCPAWGLQLDSIVLMGPFQLGIFYDSVNLL